MKHFFFRKPVIYNAEVLDDELKDKVIKLNIKKASNIKSAMKKVRNKEFIKKIIKENYNYYKVIFNKNRIVDNLKKILRNLA